MTDILICGIGGKMGQNVLALLKEDKEARAVGGVDVHAPENCPVPVFPSFDKADVKADVVVDFSAPALLPGILAYCERTGAAAVLATTGYSPEDLQKNRRGK